MNSKNILMDFVKLEYQRSSREDKEYLKWSDSLAIGYSSKILSPLYDGVKNPIWDYVESLNPEEYKRVAELGCGRGEFLSFLSRHFKEIWGFDWSRVMISIVKKKFKDKGNVHALVKDMRDLKDFHGYFDLAFSINTITPPRISIARDMVKEAFNILRLGGLFVGILPSFDTVVHQRTLTFESYIKVGLTNDEAQAKTDDYFIKRNKMDLEKGTYADDGEHIQKFFTENEIYTLLGDVGFKDIVTQKVLYPWELSKKYGYGYFPGKPEIWDWFYIANK